MGDVVARETRRARHPSARSTGVRGRDKRARSAAQYRPRRVELGPGTGRALPRPDSDEEWESALRILARLIARDLERRNLTEPVTSGSVEAVRLGR